MPFNTHEHVSNQPEFLPYLSPPPTFWAPKLFFCILKHNVPSWLALTFPSRIGLFYVRLKNLTVSTYAIIFSKTVNNFLKNKGRLMPQTFKKLFLVCRIFKKLLLDCLWVCHCKNLYSFLSCLCLLLIHQQIKNEQYFMPT